MKSGWLVIILLSFICHESYSQSWIRTNQLGYLPGSVKVAVFISSDNIKISSFEVCDAITDKVIYKGKPRSCNGDSWGMKTASRLDFSGLTTPGGYYLKAGKTCSVPFRIGADVYKGTADFILNYIRQQQCGYNPFLADSCHTHDGIIVDHPARTGEVINVTGGWHDASDHLRYTSTSANSVYQMLFAWNRSPEAYEDHFGADGRKGSNGLPDILDEARWGLEWLLKMNPDSGVMFNQVADDRDHRGFRLPTQDQATYDLGLYRPVYYVTGKPQGLTLYKNRTEGVSSTAGKLSSAFALGARTFEDYDPAFALTLKDKAYDAYEFGLTDIGTTQTACNISPYFYEEDNYVDDLELAAWELYALSGNSRYLDQADYWGTLEPVTPWIEKDTARHYQFYPFVNLGHANIGLSGSIYADRYNSFLRKGLKLINNRDKDDPFLLKIPFVWCSNNYIAAALTQCRLYYEATGDDQFAEMEAALRDWLFGCNPWGTSMICGLPEGGDYPLYPHSAVTLYLGVTTTGGLVDGPVYTSIYTGLRGIKLLRPDTYAPFQNGNVVYHDDIGDYSTNEPTLDGTASLSYYLSTLEKEGRRQSDKSQSDIVDNQGAVIRHGVGKKEIYLIFSADGYSEGFNHILKTLRDNNIKASFFLTGNFFRNKTNASYVKTIIADGHYIGPHSDAHLLYIPWENRDSLLVTREQFNSDLKANFSEIRKAGLKGSTPYYFLPPYEWYNNAISEWTSSLGLQLINFTPGTGTNADYTTPEMNNYKSSDQLFEGLIRYAESQPLNGTIILMHPGTDPARTDKFYNRLGDIIRHFSDKGYTFNKL